jgi:hypothetical protein
MPINQEKVFFFRQSRLQVVKFNEKQQFKFHAFKKIKNIDLQFLQITYEKGELFLKRMVSHILYSQKFMSL